MVGCDEPEFGERSSPVCYVGHGEAAQNPQGVPDLARWRAAQRERLRAERSGLSAARRAEIESALALHLDAALAGRDLSGTVVSGYWPIKGEPDLRPWLARLRDRGATVVLPVVAARASPLVFRQWLPGMQMERGHWNIPVPPPAAPEGDPQVILAPLVGWDARRYRLGYGGGYFDRTIAAREPKPFVIGAGLESARLPSIIPQWHDIPMDCIVTEAGIKWAAPLPDDVGR